jgi:hypothetical protein
VVPGSASFRWVGVLVEQFAHRQVQAGPVGVAAHQVRDGQGEHAVEHVHPDFSDEYRTTSFPGSSPQGDSGSRFPFDV